MGAIKGFDAAQEDIPALGRKALHTLIDSYRALNGEIKAAE